MKKNQIAALAVCAVLAAAGAKAQPDRYGDGDEDANDPINAIVKLEVETAKSDILCPWANRTGYGTGSGVVIADGLVLTCAHCVADASYIRVRKHNEDELYHAFVHFIDNDADLALVAVEEPKFMEDITPMEIGETPRVQDDVLAIG